MSGRSMLKQLLRGHRPSTTALTKLEERHDAEFKRLSTDIRPLPGAKELLRHLTRIRIPWAIATTGGRMATRRLLRHLDVPEKAVVVTGDDVAKAKPSPDVFLAAAQSLRLPIEHCIVVGDSVWDMLAAGRRRSSRPLGAPGRSRHRVIPFAFQPLAFGLHRSCPVAQHEKRMPVLDQERLLDGRDGFVAGIFQADA